jgi:hypothetical protein
MWGYSNPAFALLSEDNMSPRTTFLGRLIGLYLTLISLAMLAHKQATIESITALIHNPPVLWVVGVIAVAAGLAMVLGHNVWSGGMLPVIVTVTGWLLLIKGTLLLFLSPESASGLFLTGIHYERYFHLYMGIALFLGIYLTYEGSRQPGGK